MAQLMMSRELEAAWKKAQVILAANKMTCEPDGFWYEVPSSTGGFYPVLALFEGKELKETKCGCLSYAGGTIVRKGVTVCKHVLAAAAKIVSLEMTGDYQASSYHEWRGLGYDPENALRALGQQLGLEIVSTSKQL